MIEFTSLLPLDEWDFKRSTPHLYISHLATWTKSPKVIPAWRSNFRKIPVLAHNDNAHIPVVFTSGQPNQISNPVLPKKVLPTSNSVAFLNDNQIVSGHEDGLVRVWNASSGKLIKKLRGHGDLVNSVSVASDPKWVVSGSDDMTVRVWDSLNTNLLHNLEGHTSLVQSVGVSQDGTRIVSGSHDNTVIIWDLNSGQWQSQTLTRHTDAVVSVALSLDGTYAVSGSWDNTACIWDATIGKVQHTLEGHTDDVNSVTISSDNTRVVSGSADKTVRLWSVSTGEQIFCMDGHRGGVWTVGISSDGETIVSGGEDKRVRLWNATGQQLHMLVGHQDTIYSVAFSGNGNNIVSCAYHDSIRVWDTSDCQKLVLLDTSSRTGGFSAHTDASDEDWVSKVDPRCARWRVLDDGWVVSADLEENRLMWVDWRNFKVQDPSNTLVISKKPYWSIDFSNSIDVLGENWENCYTPV